MKVGNGTEGKAVELGHYIWETASELRYGSTRPMKQTKKAVRT